MAAAVAGLLAVVVVGVYARRAYLEALARRAAPVAVPVTVQQHSAEFKFSKVEQDRTLFTIRASQATQFKDQSRSLLQDVWITIYGREGLRNDNIHTRECSYDPKSGDVRCEGDVQIDIQGANPASGKPSDKSLQVQTKNLFFNRESGDASTPEAVAFNFPEGKGRAMGVNYSTHDSTVRLLHSVEVDFTPSDHTGGLPVTATGSSLELQHGTRTVVLHGPALVKQGDRELTAEEITIELDAEFRARTARASGHPAIRAGSAGGQFTVTADEFRAFLTPAGWLERIVADGRISGARQTPSGTDHFSTAHVEFSMQPQHNLVNDMTATGGVAVEAHQPGESHVLKTDSLRATFASSDRPDQQHIDAAETLSPATIETKTPEETTTLAAKKFNAQFSPAGRLEKLFGHSNVQVRREAGKAPPQLSTSAELVATFGATGEWATFDQTGDVHFHQADRQATAVRAHMVHATETISLDGSPVLIDSASRSTVGNITINQKSGEMRGTGGVVSTYFASGDSSGSVSIGSGPAHITSESLSGVTTSGHVSYLGHARLWQGESVLDADQIDIWRDEKKLQAMGHVNAVFPQAPGQFGPSPVQAPGQPSAKPREKASDSSQGPVLWKIHAPTLTYWNDQGKAHLEGGVSASSEQGQMDSRALDVFMAADSAQPGQPRGPNQVTRALAQGDVVVRQADRRGVAEQAEYTAADGKFVMSGGQPTIADAGSDTTTGRSLTFFVANDTILIDSQEGSRTLTKHRVEK